MSIGARRFAAACVLGAGLFGMGLTAQPAAADCDYYGNCDVTVSSSGGLYDLSPNPSCGYSGCSGSVDTNSCNYYGYCEVEINDGTGIWGTSTDYLQCEADWLGNIVCS